MGPESGIGAVGAAIPVAVLEPVATLPEEATPELSSSAARAALAPAELAQLSVTGKLLAALLQASPSAVPLKQPVALLAAPTAHTADIGAALRTGIETSGLFYESHLADWVAGQREAEALSKEPQAKKNAADEVPAILRQQLEMLDSQPLQWRGELWPGMPLQLQIDRSASGSRGDPGEDPQPAWNSTLVSELPSLGTVVAKIRIDGDRLQLKLHAGAPALLSERSAELRAALTAAGLHLQRFDADGERPA